MRGFLRKVAGLLDYETPRAEPHRDDLAIIPGLDNPADVVKREQKIDALDQAAYRAWLRRDLMSMNNWLDDRNDLRPARPAPQVPVIPGRSS